MSVEHIGKCRFVPITEVVIFVVFGRVLYKKQLKVETLIFLIRSVCERMSTADERYVVLSFKRVLLKSTLYTEVERQVV